MVDTKTQSPPDAPLGTHPRRPAWPLIALFILWCAFLVWLAVYYPAR
jgi:hypothetical protein